MATEISFDIFEQILLRLDVEDLIRCKSVCKSCYYIISSPSFVEAHLKYSHNKDRDHPKLGLRRIARPGIRNVDDSLCCNSLTIVGSCNGLVCVSPIDAEFVVTNPSTRELRKLETPTFQPDMRRLSMIRQIICWGFGYDSSIDDYKVIAGFRKSYSRKLTSFYVLTLTSNTWRRIGKVKYRSQYHDGVTGVLYGGALHWFMWVANKKVIVSLDLSTHEFKEIPPPTDEEYGCYEEHILGVLDECLCIFSYDSSYSIHRWVMRNNAWEKHSDPCESKYDVVHELILNATRYDYTLMDGKRVPSAGDYIRARMFVKSLVSPHSYNNYNDEGQI